MEELWQGAGRWNVLPIGEVQIVRSAPILNKGQTYLENLHSYEVLREQNAITISSNVDLTSNNNFSWNNFFSLTQQGVVRKLTVNVAPSEEKQLRCPDAVRKQAGTETLICIDAGSGAVQEIVRSQKFQSDIKKCWLMMGNHSWKWSNTARKIRGRQGKVTDENMKFMAIAEYEDFAKKWNITLVDYAPRSGSFVKQEQFDNVLRRATITDKPQ